MAKPQVAGFNVVTEVEDRMFDTDELFEEVILPSLLEGVEAIAERARENLDKHRSAVTGTGALQSRKFKPHHGPPLADQVRVFGIWMRDEGTAEASVVLDSDVAYIGRFLEQPREAVFWGHHAGRPATEHPWLRPAYEQGRQEAKDRTKWTLAKLLKKFNRRRRGSGKTTKARAA